MSFEFHSVCDGCQVTVKTENPCIEPKDWSKTYLPAERGTPKPSVLYCATCTKRIFNS